MSPSIKQTTLKYWTTLSGLVRALYWPARARQVAEPEPIATALPIAMSPPRRLRSGMGPTTLAGQDVGVTLSLIPALLAMMRRQRLVALGPPPIPPEGGETTVIAGDRIGAMFDGTTYVTSGMEIY